MDQTFQVPQANAKTPVTLLVFVKRRESEKEEKEPDTPQWFCHQQENKVKYLSLFHKKLYSIAVTKGDISSF